MESISYNSACLVAKRNVASYFHPIEKTLARASMAGAFQVWVTASGGPEKVARKLRVSTHSVKYWINRRGSPQVNTLLKIIRLSKDHLTYKSIIESTHPSFRKGR